MNESLTNDNDPTVGLLKCLENLGKPLMDETEDVDEPAGAQTKNQTNWQKLAVVNLRNNIHDKNC